MTKRREDSSRKVRSDKKYQFPLRYNKDSTHEAIDVIVFNTKQPKGLIINLLLEAALQEENIINGIYCLFPPRDNMIIIRRND